MSSKAQVTWVGPGLRLLGEANGGPAIVLDGHGEHQTGPTPMELVLIGLAGCTAMDVVSIMAKKRQPLTSLQVQVEAERAHTHPKVYTAIHIKYIAYGENISMEALQRAIELSKHTYCSVSAMLNQTATITTSFEIVSDRPAPHVPADLTH